MNFKLKASCGSLACRGGTGKHRLGLFSLFTSLINDKKRVSDGLRGAGKFKLHYAKNYFIFPMPHDSNGILINFGGPEDKPAIIR